MAHRIALVACLLALGSPALAIESCINDLTSKLQKLCVPGLVEKMSALGSFDFDHLSKGDAARFSSVKGSFKDGVLQVHINYPNGSEVTKKYFVTDNGDCTYEETEVDNKENHLKLCPALVTEKCCCVYGCTSNPNFSTHTPYVACLYGPGVERKCKEEFEKIVGDYVELA